MDFLLYSSSDRLNSVSAVLLVTKRRKKALKVLRDGIVLGKLSQKCRSCGKRLVFSGLTPRTYHLEKHIID